jgi:hypothetical protein
MNERDEPRKAKDGKWYLWHVVESEVEGAGGCWPLAEITMSSVSSALSELYLLRQSLAQQIEATDATISQMEDVKTTLRADAPAKPEPS